MAAALDRLKNRWIPRISAGIVASSSLYQYSRARCDSNGRRTSTVRVCKEKDLIAFEAPHGEIIEEIFGETSGGTRLHSLARCRIPFGKAALIHYHPKAEETYYILSGVGTMSYCAVLDEQLNVSMDDDQNKDELIDYWKHNKQTTMMKPGDSIVIPKHNWHQIMNNEQEDLVFIVTCAPSWTPDCAVNLV